jgi:uncharacterized protein (DUF2249 family)
MQVSTSKATEHPSVRQPEPFEVLGNLLFLNLEDFPELSWLPDYLAALQALHQEHDRLSGEIEAIRQAGDVYRDQWIEPYIKTKNGKQYTYHQLRWLTGERKKSGQPKVKTKHLPHYIVNQIEAAIKRGHQIEALEQQQKLIDVEINKLKQQVQRTGNRLHRQFLKTQ